MHHALDHCHGSSIQDVLLRHPIHVPCKCIDILYSEFSTKCQLLLPSNSSTSLWVQFRRNGISPCRTSQSGPTPTYQVVKPDQSATFIAAKRRFMTGIKQTNGEAPIFAVGRNFTGVRSMRWPRQITGKSPTRELYSGLPPLTGGYRALGHGLLRAFSVAAAELQPNQSGNEAGELTTWKFVISTTKIDNLGPKFARTSLFFTVKAVQGV